MVTLLASITGFLGSLFPEIIKYFIDSKDKAHEIEILKYQIKHKGHLEQIKQQEIGIHYDLLEAKSLYSTFKSGISWVDALNSTVRPVLAYSFFAIYCVVKWLEFQLFELNKVKLEDGFDILWSLEDQAIFAGIISFYYGNRAINKILNKK